MKSYFARRYAVEKLLPVPQTQRTMVGMFIRRTIGKGEFNTGTPILPIRTFRVIHGNGKYGSRLGELIQHQYAYNVSDPNADHVGQVNKDDFAAAVAGWQALTPEDKMRWNYRAQQANLHMSGYNLYIRKWRLKLL